MPRRPATGRALGTTLRIDSLQWVVGAFIASLGAMMLVSPHQFSAAPYAPISPQLAWFGPGFILAGGGLLVTAALGPQFRFVLVAHVFAGTMLMVLAAGFTLSGSWSGSSNYGLLGLGTAVAPLLRRTDPGGDARPAGDAAALLIGLATLLTGCVFLATPGQFSAPFYDPVRAYLPWYAGGFVAAGIILSVSQLGDLVPPRLGRWSPLPVAAVLFLFGSTVVLPSGAWTGIAYYVGFAAALVILAWMGPRPRRADQGSLRGRLALVLAAAAAVPVLVLTPIYSREEERQALTAQFVRQEALADALAQDVEDYVFMHQSAAIVLATQPGLLGLTPGDQQLLLQSTKGAYSDIDSFGIVNAQGAQVASSDDRPRSSWIGDPLFETVRQTDQPALDIRLSPDVHRPVFELGVPVLDADGHFGGMVSAALDSARVVGFLTRGDSGDGAQIYLVDGTGRAIVHPDPNVVASRADLSSNPSVLALLSDPAPGGSLHFASPGGEVLASFARVPELAWGVVIERASTVALAPARGKLDLLFGGLVVVIGAAAGFGILAAGWLNRPLVTLGAAVDGLAAGDDSAPLPAGGPIEIAGLAAAFGTMRARVIGHTAELLAANRELEAIYRVGQVITAPLELDVVLNTIARCTAELLGTECGVILLVDEATQTLSVRGAFGISDHAVQATRDRIGESIAGRVVQSGQPIVANDLPNNPLYFNPAAEEDRLLACASVPLIVGERTIGTLDALSKTNRFAFDDHHVHVLQMLASQAAVALENARLFQEVRVARDELEARVQARTAELRRTEAQARRLIESNVIGTIVAHLGGQIIEANDAFLRVVGYSHAEVESGQLRWDTLTPAELRPFDGRAIEELRATGISSQRETEYLARNGQRVPVLVGMALLEEDPDTCVAFILDLSERKQAEAEIRALNGDLERRVVERTAALEAANHELEAFSYSVSHDLRAPLRAVNGFSRILLEEHAGELTDDAQAHLRTIGDSAQHMGQLIDDLLAFSRLGRQSVRKQRVQPAEVARGALAELALEQEGRSVEIVIGDVPTCEADPSLLRQVYVNLLANALKFTRRRAVGHIEVGCQQTDAEMVYFVKDDGAGFNMRYVDKLFGVFQRLHRAEEYEGTGVGLAIVQRIVQRHGGRIWADGVQDRGATFFFTLQPRVDRPATVLDESTDDGDGTSRRAAA